MLVLERSNASHGGGTNRWPAELHRAGKLFEVMRGDRIYAEGDDADGIYFLVTGGLKLMRRMPQRGDFILDLVWPGGLFGEEGALAGRRRLASALALGDCRFLHVTRASLSELFRSSPMVAFDLLERMAKRQGAVFERMLELTWPKPADRIASAHERLADLVGGGGEGVRVAVADVAAHACASAHAVRTHLASGSDRMGYPSSDS